MWGVILVVVLLINISVPPTHQKALQNGFVAQLIHKTSPLSPFYTPDATFLHLQKQSIAQSAARNHHFSCNRTLIGSSYVLVPPSSHDFVMSFSLGIPPAQAFAIPDTATDLVWIHCGPCNTCLSDSNQTVPLYDPNLSYAHHSIPCDAPLCQRFPQANCSLDGLQHCTYAVHYPDQSYSFGVIGEDYSFSYRVGNSNVTVDRLFFGCGTHNFDFGGQGLPGIVGLRTGSANISLLDQLLTPSFSYCQTPAQVGGYIKFGSESILGQGLSTPLLGNGYGNYHLGLLGISVDGQDVNFTRDFFEMNGGPTETGFIIDTGTTYTLLYTEAYDQFLAVLKNANPLRERETFQNPIWELCYDDISGAPEIELVFTNLAFPLSDVNAWVDGPGGLFCLAMQRTPNLLSVMGMYQQRGINIGFDLVNSQVWFQYQNGNCPE